MIRRVIVNGRNLLNLQVLARLHAKYFDYLGDDLSVLNGKDAIFIDSDSRFKNYEKKELKLELLNYFHKVEQLEPIIIKKGDRDIRKYWVFYCSNYDYQK